jgi:hypothetical protein
MSVSRCPACAAIRPPNARYCPTCGTSFDPALAAPTMPPREVELGMSLWTAVKIGIGITLGAALVGVMTWVFILVAVAIGFGLGPRP